MFIHIYMYIHIFIHICINEPHAHRHDAIYSLRRCDLAGVNIAGTMNGKSKQTTKHECNIPALNIKKREFERYVSKIFFYQTDRFQLFQEWSSKQQL